MTPTIISQKVLLNEAVFIPKINEFLQYHRQTLVGVLFFRWSRLIYNAAVQVLSP
jgi:hypothetical protein